MLRIYGGTSEIMKELLTREGVGAVRRGAGGSRQVNALDWLLSATSRPWGDLDRISGETAGAHQRPFAAAKKRPTAVLRGSVANVCCAALRLVQRYAQSIH